MENTALHNEKQNAIENYLLNVMFSEDGWGTKLLTPIGKIDIADPNQGNSFQAFLGMMDVGEAFCVEDMIVASEANMKRRFPAASLNDGIYLLSGTSHDSRLQDVLINNSVPGLCGLLRVCTGIELNMPAGCEIDQFVRYRFFFLREKDADALARAEAQMGNAVLTRVGTVLPDSLTFVENGNVLFRKSYPELLPYRKVGLQLGDDCADVYEEGMQAARSAFCSSRLPMNIAIHIPSTLPLPQLCAAELGILESMRTYPLLTQALRFAEGGRVAFIVPRPYVAAGDKVYILHPKSDAFGKPLPDQMIRLRDYLAEEYNAKKIKSVLPLKKNAMDMLHRLCGDDLTFVADREPISDFAMLVIVPHDGTASGTYLGTFQLR